jgi:hypothetical protein
LSTLSSVIIRGTLAAMPAAGIPGRTYYTSDTLQVFYDDGVTWKTRSLRPAGTKTPRAHARAGPGSHRISAHLPPPHAIFLSPPPGTILVPDFVTSTSGVHRVPPRCLAT